MITDPLVSKLNGTQLVFEAESINIEQEKKYEDLALMAGAAKKAVIQLLGLNIIPMEDSETKLLRLPEDHEILPLIMTIGNEHVLKEIAKRHQDLEAQELAMEQLEKEKESGEEMSASDFDDFMDSDVDFIDEDEVKRRMVTSTPEYDYVNKNMVGKMDEAAKEKFEKMLGVGTPIIPEDFKKFIAKSSEEKTKSVKIESEDVGEYEDIIDPAFANRKPRIVIEPEDD